MLLATLVASHLDCKPIVGISSGRKMISLRQFMLVVVTLVCREFFDVVPSAAFGTSLLQILGLCLGFGLLLKMRALSILTYCNVGARCHDRFLAARRVVEYVWVVSLPLTLGLTEWVAWMGLLEESGCPASLSILCCFLPSLLFIAFVELTAAQTDDILEQRLAMDRSDASLGWTALFWMRLRLGDMTAVLTCIAPVLATAAVIDLLPGICEWLRIETFHTALLAMLGVVLLCLGLAMFPACLSRWMGALPASPANLNQQIAAFAQRLGLGKPSLRIIGSHGRWNGAAVVGWLPATRQLWLSDKLLRELDMRELEMVILHELAHLKRYHFLIRLLPVVVVGCMVAGIYSMNLDSTAIALSVPIKVLIAALFLTSLLAGISWAAHYCELDADRQACHYALSSCDWVSPLVRPPEILGRALAKLLLDAPEARKATWLHPSLARRIANLRLRIREESVTAKLVDSLS